MNIVLHDLDNHLKFAPLSLTRPIGNLRMGMFTNNERCSMYFTGAEVSYATQEYLAGKFPEKSDANTINVDATVIFNEALAKEVKQLVSGSQITLNGKVIISVGIGLNDDGVRAETRVENVIQISERWHLFQKNGEVLQSDFSFYTKGKKSKAISETNTIIGDKSQIFLEEGASVEASILNTKTGPIYVANNAEIMEGSVVRGPLAMAEHAALKLATKVYGPSSLGEHCKVGGEINNVIFQAYSNKGHDGFLGNALVGEWCNLGADTNSSNLKNNYGFVKAYSYLTKKIEATDVQFMGLVMGDHSKCGINTMFNTATVVGVSANIYGGDFPDKYIPSFAWGGDKGFVSFKLEKAYEVAENMMGRRKVELTEQDKFILKYVADNYGQQ